VNSIDSDEIIDRTGIRFHKNKMLKTFGDSLIDIWQNDNMTMTWKLINTVQSSIQNILEKGYKLLYYYLFPLLVVYLVLFYGDQIYVAAPTSYL